MKQGTHPQATRYTQAELDNIAYWEKHGYTFGPNDPAPADKLNPPACDYARQNPKTDAALSLAVVVLGAAVLVTLLVGLVVGWFAWHK
jgi:hypothetical protein